MDFPAEPVMHVVIVVPQAFAARVAARLAPHRGRLESSAYHDGVQTIRADVPQAQVAAFVSEVLADTNNQARLSMALSEYWPAPERPPGEPMTGCAGTPPHGPGPA